MRVLDLFCGAGGATVGYQRAGFEVVGVDINPQPDYPGTFVQANALDLPASFFQGAALVHASAPCQYDAAITRGTNKRLRHTYPDLIGPTRQLLESLDIPHVIENPAARSDMVLCGEMFGLRVLRHRRFETGGWSAVSPKHVKHRGLTLGMRHGKLVTADNGGYYFAVYGDGGYKGTIPQWQGAMGIDWTNNRKSIAEAIPPAYTEYVGRQFLAQA